jgi:hypothetical protein
MAIFSRALQTGVIWLQLAKFRKRKKEEKKIGEGHFFRARVRCRPG